jgi:hypothetical protein
MQIITEILMTMWGVGAIVFFYLAITFNKKEN